MDRLRGALGWSALTLVLGSALANGGHPAVIWSLLCLGLLLLFAVQVVLDVATGMPAQARRITLIGGLYFGVLLWLQLQGMVGLPASMHHPVWTIAPQGAVPRVSADPDSGGSVVMRLTCYALVFWILLRSATDARRAASFIRAFALFSAALAVYGILSRLAGTNLLLGIENDLGPVRASFFNRNSYATFAVFGALANITVYYRLTFRTSGLSRRAALRDYLESFFAGAWVHALGAFLCLGALAMTASRAGGTAGVIGLLVLIWALRRREGGSQALLWAVPAVLIGFVLLVMTADVAERMANSDLDARFLVYPRVVEGILDRPLLGHGAGAFLHAFRPYVPLEAAVGEWDLAHNSYLENAFEFGLPAAAVFYAALALIGARLLQGVLRRRRSQSVPAFAFACFVAAAFHSMLDFSLQIPAIAASFAAILGIGWAQSFTAGETGRRRRSAATGTLPRSADAADPGE